MRPHASLATTTKSGCPRPSVADRVGCRDNQPLPSHQLLRGPGAQSHELYAGGLQRRRARGHDRAAPHPGRLGSAESATGGLRQGRHRWTRHRRVAWRRATLSEGGVLGVKIEAQFHGPIHPFANTFHNIDGILRNHGFTLFDLNQRRYSRAALPDAFFASRPGRTRTGQLLWGTRSICATSRRQLRAHVRLSRLQRTRDEARLPLRPVRSPRLRCRVADES